MNTTLQQVQTQIIHLVNENQFEDSLALYKEWEEHFLYANVRILAINNLTHSN